MPDVMSTKRSYTLKRNWSLNVRHETVNIEEVIRNSTFSIRCRNGYHRSSTGYLAIHNLNFVTNFSFWHSFRKGTTRGFSWNIYNAKYILYLEWLVMRHGRYRISKFWKKYWIVEELLNGEKLRCFFRGKNIFFWKQRFALGKGPASFLPSCY